MSHEDLLKLANKKKLQSQVVSTTAATHPDEQAQQILREYAAELLKYSGNLLKKARAVDEILTLQPTLPQADIDIARTKQSVKIGDDYYLPIFHTSCVSLPHIFVRSSLFPASLSPEPITSDELTPLKSWSREHAINSRALRSRLCSFDRAVFAACLIHFKDRPLSSEDDDHSVSTTIRKLSESLGITHGSGVADRIKASLERLSSTEITVQHKDTLLELKSLISIEIRTESPKAVNIKIPKDLTVLYKQEKWWSIPLSVITKPGLAGWLGCYYSTHEKWASIKLTTLKELSGLSIEGSVFKATLKKALNSLQDSSIPERARIKSYAFEKSSENGNEYLLAKTYTMNGPAVIKKPA